MAPGSSIRGILATKSAKWTSCSTVERAWKRVGMTRESYNGRPAAHPVRSRGPAARQRPRNQPSRARGQSTSLTCGDCVTDRKQPDHPRKRIYITALIAELRTPSTTRYTPAPVLNINSKRIVHQCTWCTNTYHSDPITITISQSEAQRCPRPIPSTIAIWS